MRDLLAALQVRRLNMYNTRAVRDKKGRILHEVSFSGAGAPTERRGSCCSRLVGSVLAPHAATAAADVGGCPPAPQDLQSKDLPTTRIQPDRRWFGNTRVIGQKQLEQFREEMSSKINDSYTVLLREKKLPLQLLEDPERKVGAKQARADLLGTQPFAETFGPNRRRKRPKLAAEGYADLVQGALQSEQQ